MRTSVDNTDPGYKNFYFGWWDVFLDGLPVRKCITADEEEGFVLVLETDSDGHIVINPDWTVSRVRWIGKVEIRPRTLAARIILAKSRIAEFSWRLSCAIAGHRRRYLSHDELVELLPKGDSRMQYILGGVFRPYVCRRCGYSSGIVFDGEALPAQMPLSASDDPGR